MEAWAKGPRRRGWEAAGRAALRAVTVAIVVAGCAAPESPRRRQVWVMGEGEPAFDPSGPPAAARWALERLLGSGLVGVDSIGRVVPAAAARWLVAEDGREYRFVLRRGLAFADGTPCTSEDFGRALEAALGRADHGIHAWLLSALAGLERYRPGRPLPALGIACPDDSTLVLRLSRPDPQLLHKLALPGVADPWRSDAGPWRGGLGAYRLAGAEAGRSMILVPRWPEADPETLEVRFAVGAARARALLRQGVADLLWPVPPGLLEQPLPAGYRERVGEALPPVHLYLVLRADLHPTARVAARQALAHGLNRGEILAGLARRRGRADDWLADGSPFPFPSRDPEAVRDWLERGRLGRSLHVVLAFSADGAGAEVARSLQGEWARSGLDVELRPLRGQAWVQAQLARGGAQLLLVESQALLDDPAAELAALVQPLRGGPAAAFRTGWRTREFDRWIGRHPPAATLDPAAAERRVAEERIAIPLARLPWVWIERNPGRGWPFHPRFGPEGGTPGRPASVPGLHR